jgi:hypothetical protein
MQTAVAEPLKSRRGPCISTTVFFHPITTCRDLLACRANRKIASY